MKTCKTCGKTKAPSDFYKSRLQCKKCISAESKKKYIENRDKVLIRAAEYRDKHRKEINQYFRDRYKNNRELILTSQKEYNIKHREEKKAYLKRYYRENKACLLAKSLERQRQRLRNDPLYKIKRQARLLIWKSFNRKGVKKHCHTEAVLGCALEEFAEYLKQTWRDHYGVEWFGQPCHIDHIIPLATAKTEEDVIRLCHYTNLRLLTPDENLSKRDKILERRKSIDKE